jgi:hypothetical protein
LNFELAYAEIPRCRPPLFLSHPVIPRLTIAITLAVTLAVIPSEARKLPPLLPYDGGNGRRFLSPLEMTAQKVEMTAQRWRKGGAKVAQ